LIGELDGLSRAGDVVYLDALRALKVLTGLDLGSGPEAAAKWRQLTPAPPILPVRSARGAGKTIVKSFFDHRIYSLHPLFIVDVSRSMDTSTGFLTRREVLFRELEGALGSLEEAARFHVIAFDGELHPWPEGPREAVEDSIAGAGRFLRSLPRGKGTNYYVALRAALDAKEFDTAYFLSDGEPTAGEIRESGPLARWFKEANLERGLVVNTVGIGDNGGILRMIAVQSGGAYRPMREDTIDG
jgi:hypothetical protein